MNRLSIVHLTTQAPSRLAEDLLLFGHKVFEALAVSEVLHLQEHEDIDVVLISAEVKRAVEKEQLLRGMILRLQPNATQAQVEWTLSLLFPDSGSALQ
jgi:hypothetical protein